VILGELNPVKDVEGEEECSKDDDLHEKVIEIDDGSTNLW
jgi:hypothetical protein